jgi:hypothetical protein
MKTADAVAVHSVGRMSEATSGNLRVRSWGHDATSGNDCGSGPGYRFAHPACFETCCSTAFAQSLTSVVMGPRSALAFARLSGTMSICFIFKQPSARDRHSCESPSPANARPITGRRPRESGDPYAVSPVLRPVVQRLSPNLSRLWLWVPDRRSRSLACPGRRAFGSISNSDTHTTPRSRRAFPREF